MTQHIDGAAVANQLWWDDPPRDHRPAPPDHDGEIWKAVDALFDYKNERFICSVEEVIAQVAPRFPMCSFEIIEDKFGAMTNVAWRDIKKPKPILPDDETNLVRPRFPRR